MTLLHFKLILAVYHRFNIAVFGVIWIQFFGNPADNIGNRRAAVPFRFLPVFTCYSASNEMIFALESFTLNTAA